MTKIAFPSEDGETISAHLGRAPFFVVATLEPGAEPRFERRSKEVHDHGHDAHPGQVLLMEAAPANAEGAHGHSHAMMDAIADCAVLISRGMGQGAHERAASMGLEIVLTGEKRIVDALAAHRAGTLVSDLARLHRH